MLNMDFTQRVVIDTKAQPWMPSPKAGVWRKPLAREEAERGHATSIVRYDPGAHFSGHNHPGGEEILVLDGIFSDETGDFSAGTYFRNPLGFRHTPFSKDGCLILVKLHQFQPDDDKRLAIKTGEGQWQDVEHGVRYQLLHGFKNEHVALVHLPAGAPGIAHPHPGGEEVYVISGTNREYFGGTQTDRGKSGYPLCRLVALMALRSHLLAAAAFGPYQTGEIGYAEGQWDQLPDFSLLIGDRGFVSAWLMWMLQSAGKQRHWLIRGKKKLKVRTVRKLGSGDELVEMKVSREARKKHPELPTVLMCRRITYQRKGYRPQTLLTSLVEPSAYPKKDIVELYHERCELELGYDELKTQMLDREETLRSQSPELVEQELWGTLLSYNLVRLEMERLAGVMGVEPVQLSFSGTLMMLLQMWQLMSLRYPGSIVKIMRSVEAQMQRLLLPPRRSHRVYPRAVKIKMSNYARKRPGSPTKEVLN